MDIFEKRLLRFLAGYCMLWAATVILSRTVLMLNFIPSGSMEGTIRTGDFVLGTRYDIGEGDIERYDILVFALPDEPDTVYIKRVIGLPGETVVVCDGSVYADGVRLDDSFVKNPMNTKGDGTYVVPDGCYFVMGDNRNQSDDSRFWTEKYVPVENVEGKAKFIVFPFKNIGAV
jgi:signal peptidase I